MAAEELFRFINVRPAQRIVPARTGRRFPAYDDVAISPFHRTLRDLAPSDARDRASTMARERLTRGRPGGDRLDRLTRARRRAADAPTVADARQILEDELGQALDDFLADAETRRMRDDLWDRLYAHALVPEESADAREAVVDGIRSLHFLEFMRGQADADEPVRPDELSGVTPLVPQDVIPAHAGTGTDWEGPYRQGLLDRLHVVHDRVVALENAREDLRNNDRIFKEQELRTVTPGARLDRARFQPITGVQLTGPSVELPPQDVGPPATDRPGPQDRVVIVPKKISWVFGDFGPRNLNRATQELIAANRLGFEEREALEIVEELGRQQYVMVAEFLSGLPQGAIGYLAGTPRFQSLTARVRVPGIPVPPALAPLPVPGSPAARGIRPLGVGDLLVVKQDLLRYTPGEVAHIENVLRAESKTRTHTRMREVEEVVITETEELQETEKDLQTTERFELQKEAQRTIENELSFQAGVAVTASYGPVSVTAHADFALTQSSSESNRTASTFARQITERSVNRLLRRAREERTRRTLERFEEKNEHILNNVAGDGHVIGIYRWVDKYYNARLINYGKRLMIEFVIPEPAAFYLALQPGQTLKGVTLKKPEPPLMYGQPLRPDDLNANNYTKFVADYNVQDVAPYPAEIVNASAAFAEAGGTDQNVGYGKTSEKLSVPPGYVGQSVYGEFNYHGYGGFYAECFVAGQRWGSITAAGLEGIVPISVTGWFLGFHVNIVVVCALKPEARQAWRLKTFQAIMNAYEQALAAYNEQVAAAEIQAGIRIEGRNPGLNRKLEQDELRKGALRLLTNNFAQTRVGGTWRYNELFDAMRPGGQFGHPEFDIPEAITEGRIIQFFEQAFDWSNMTYRFYPYFWGRKNAWEQTFPLTDPDPMFTDFLRAGAARIIVPAHPAYSETVLHYLWTSEIWNGGNPPLLNDPLFVSIVDELKRDSGADLDDDLNACSADAPYPCLVDEWEVKLPTTLVYLQEDATLPDLGAQP
jgi:hypothetical protein